MSGNVLSKWIPHVFVYFKAGCRIYPPICMRALCVGALQHQSRGGAMQQHIACNSDLRIVE